MLKQNPAFLCYTADVANCKRGRLIIPSIYKIDFHIIIPTSSGGQIIANFQFVFIQLFWERD